MPVRPADIDLAHRLADAAGAVIRPYFRKPHGLETKADHSPVTLADKEAEAAMRRLLDAECAGDGVHGEEYGIKPGVTNRQWVLDPIDGTRSFTAGRAIFGTLIALLEDGWPVLGIIDQPIQRERWVGVAGRPTVKLRVPSIGSSTHLRLVTPAFSPYSSPMMPSPERSASSSRRIAASASRSARVTGDWSSLISTPCSWRK